VAGLYALILSIVTLSHPQAWSISSSAFTPNNLYNKSSFFSLKFGGKTEMGNIIDYGDKSVNILILRDITLDRRKNIIKSFLR